jgi:N-acetylmuramoyl-L-alanine amidase
MKISNHLLFDDNGNQVSYKATPNKGSRYVPQYLVMHYTAATTATSAINWFLRPVAQASAHLLIDRDGNITQFAPFNIVTWHAGTSVWNGLIGLNKYAIGIELVNAGRLTKSGEKWICPVDKKQVKNDDVIIATHKNESKDSGWQEYSEAQLEVSIEVGALLVSTYKLKDVVGHEDISPYRKSDPGPAFPMSSFRSKVMGRRDESIDQFKTTTAVNIRSGPGTNFAAIAEPLPESTSVIILKREGNWSFVEVLDKVNGEMDLEGWVFNKYLVKA